MGTSNWLEEVGRALRRQGLTSAYIRRFTDELADHCDDLFQENLSMDAKQISARLGSPAELADRAAQQLRRRTYAGRHPLVTFVAAPLPTAALLLVAVCLTFVLALTLLPEASSAEERTPIWSAAVMQAIVWAMRYVPFTVGAALFCQLARRAGCTARWSLVACALIALLAALFAANLTLPTSGPGSGALTVGLSVPPAPIQLVQALAPLAIWALYAANEFRRRHALVAM